MHTIFIFAVLAAASASTTATGIAGVTPESGSFGDAMWQVYDGGDSIRYCMSSATAGSFCTDAALASDPPWGTVFAIVDPVNLGRAMVQMSVSNVAGDYYYSAYGSLTIHDETMRVTSAHGMWAAGLGAGLYHCQIEVSGPTCRQVRSGGDELMPMVVLGMSVRRTGAGLEDVIWFHDILRGVYRCTAGPEQPEPQCAEVRMPG